MMQKYKCHVNGNPCPELGEVNKRGGVKHNNEIVECMFNGFISLDVSDL
jgi:hypothetical protein